MSKQLEKGLKEKELEKVKREKELEKFKPEKELVKEIEKVKPEKEFDKLKHEKEKDIEKIKPEKEFDKKREKELEKLKPEKELAKEIEKVKPEKEQYEKLKPEKELEKGIVEGQDIEQASFARAAAAPQVDAAVDSPSKLLEKRIDKIKAEKEFTKHEPKEIKEPKEFKEFKEGKEIKEGKEVKEGGKELKEPKEFKERKEHKEGKVEFKEPKEFKELKEYKEAEVKDFSEKTFETPQDFAAPVQGAEQTTLDARLSRLESAVVKQVDKNFEKKIEHKEKIEKYEHKEKFEKIEHKEFKIEKPEHGKEFIVEKGFETGPIGLDPGKIEGFAAPKPAGTVEERVARLEAALLGISHFIGVDLRPDLSAGALIREPDVAPPPPTKVDVAPPPPTKRAKKTSKPK